MKKVLSIVLLMGILISMMGTASVVLAAEEAASDIVYETIFEDDFSSQGRWTVDKGTISSTGGAVKVSNTTTANLKLSLSGIPFRKGMEYRVSYRTKASMQSYFLTYNFSSNKVQTSEGGSYANQFYDHTVEGGRGTARNYIDGVETDDWVDVSYQFKIHGIQDASGNAVGSAGLYYLQFQLNGAPEFYIDSLKIEVVKTKNNYLSKTIFEDDCSWS